MDTYIILEIVYKHFDNTISSLDMIGCDEQNTQNIFVINNKKEWQTIFLSVLKKTHKLNQYNCIYSKNSEYVVKITLKKNMNEDEILYCYDIITKLGFTLTNNNDKIELNEISKKKINCIVNNLV